METSYVSDAVDVPSEALMDEPFCEIKLDLSLLPVEQQVQLAHAIGLEHLDSDEMRAAIGGVTSGADDEPYQDLSATLHVDAPRAVTLLEQVGMVNMGGDEKDEDPEAELEEINDDDE